MPKPALLAIPIRLAATGLAADPFDPSSVPLEVQSPDPKLAKIVLLAGAPSNKPGQHEYFAGCALLPGWLKQTPGVWPVLAREWPGNEDIFQRAKAAVYYGDGGKQPFIDPARRAAFSQLMDSGAGLALVHQAMDFPAGPDADRVKDWLGGVFHSDIGCRGHWDMEFARIPVHAVTRGVTPFAAPADGWLYNLHFAADGRFTPLLAGTVPDKSRTTADARQHIGRDEVIAWAYERPGGGRGFAFTGADLHKRWAYESQRKLVVNGILWSAGLDLPTGGAPVDFKEADLNRNLDDKRTPAKKSAAK